MTVQQQPSDMMEYLESTPLCDCDNVELKKKATEIVQGADTQKEAALRIFRFVRDGIPFNATLDIWQRASKTLQKRVVDYCNKINVQIALLRAVGIPANCHFVRMEKEILKHFIPGFLYNQLPSPVGHFWCECHLSEKWLACETLFDEPLYQGMLKSGWVTEKQIPTVDWDGENDLILLKPWIVKDGGIYGSFDDLVKLAQAEGMPPKIFCKIFEWLPALFSSQRTNKVRRQ